MGDEIVFNYNKCVTSKFTLSGTAKVTLRANVQPSATGDLNTNFDVLLTLFSIATSTAFDIFDGTANMKSSSTGSLNTITNEFTVPAGQTLTFATSTSRFDYLGGTSYSETDSVAPNSVSSRLDGTLRIQQTLETRNYSIKTLSPLVGTFSSAGAFTPTSGVIESTHVERNLATSTTISGINAQVSGDTDQNGSKDLTFTELTSSLLH